jgi:hypothetical protein
VLEPTKAAVLAEYKARKSAGINPERFLIRKAKNSFCNTSPMDIKTLMGDQDHIKENLYSYIQAFSSSVRDIFERFDFYRQIELKIGDGPSLPHSVWSRSCMMVVNITKPTGTSPARGCPVLTRINTLATATASRATAPHRAMKVY